MKKYSISFTLNFISLLLFSKIFIVSAVLIFISPAAYSQTSIQISLQQPPPNQLSISDLYNIDLNNTSNKDVEFYLYGTLNESKAGLIATATTIPIKLNAKERRRFKASDLPKTPEVSYPSRDNRYKDALMRKGSLPDGNYTICVYAKQTGTNDELGSDCKDNEIKILQETEITLLMPENNSEIEQTTGLNFVWSVFGGQTGACKIKIVEIKSDESPINAFKGNKPFFESDSIPGKITTYQVPASGPKFEPGKRYAWQVNMGKFKSEVFSFMIVSGGGQITVSLTPVIAANCCFAVNVNNTTGTLIYDAFKMTLSSNTIQSANPVNCITTPSAPPSVNTMLWKGLSDFQAGTNNYGTVCFTNTSVPYKIIIQWSTNGGESFADIADTLSLYCGQTSPSSFCTDFENGTISNWITYNTYNGVTSTQTANLQNVTPGSDINPSNNALHITDVFGSTFIYNKLNFSGNYSQFTGSCLCYDFKLTTNVAGANVSPTIYLLQNFDETQPLAWGTNPQNAACFTASASITLNSNWVHICAPLGPCTGGVLPTSSEGKWKVLIGGDTCTNWTNLLSNVSAVMFAVDMSGWGGQEIFEIDNVCIMNCNQPGSSNPCDSLNATVSLSPAGNCCGQINLSHPQTLTGVNTIEFLPLGQNTFISGSLGSGYTGWMYTSSSPQNYTVKNNSGVPGGQLNGFFNFCLSTLSSPQQIIVNWKNDNTIVCSDTVTVNCNIPCVTFNKDTLVCDGSNYNLTYSITNNSNFSIGTIEYTVLSPSGAVITPVSSTISSALGSNQSSSSITAVISGADENTNICVLMKYISPDNCCWCYDTLCITTPSCICEDVSASITGDPYNCCYDLNLINNAPANYFTQVKLKTGSGTMFSTWTAASGSGWGSMNIFPSNEIQFVHSSGFIPAGNQNNILNFCLAGFTASPQKILVEWIKDAEIVCVDTLTTECPPREEPKNSCAQIINDSIECLANGTFKYNFQIQNNSNNTTTGFMLNPISPSGLSLSPANFPNVSIGPNGISAPQSLIISGVGEGVNVCFETAIYKHVGQNYSWCCHGDTVCITTPVCNPPEEPPCKFKVKVIEVKCQDEHGNPVYNIEFKISNPNSNPVMLNSITASNLTLTSPALPSIINPGTSNISCVFAASGAQVNPACFIFVFTDEKNPKDTCKVRTCTDLPDCKQVDCSCDKKWSGNIKIGSVTAECNSKKLYTANTGNTVVSAPVYNCISPCVPKYQYTVKKSGQTVTSGTGNSFSYNFPAGTYDVFYEVYCGEKLCGECNVRIKFSGGPK